MGSRSAALRAGYTPKNTPTESATNSPAKTLQMAISAGKPATAATPFAPPMPSTMPTAPPMVESVPDSIRNCFSTSPRLAPSALRTPISRVALSDRDEHDVHDHDPADDQRDGCDHDGDAADGVADGGKQARERVRSFKREAVLCGGEIVALAAHNLAGLVAGELHLRGAVAGLGVDGEGFRGAVGALEGGERHGDPVVLALAERLALLFAEANDGIGHAVDADLLADGVFALEEVFFDVRADEADVRGVVVVGLREAAAFDDVEVLHLGHEGGVAANLGVRAGLREVDDLADGRLERANLRAGRALGLHGAELLQRDDLALLVLQVLLVAGGESRFLRDGEDVRALVVDLGGNVDVRAVDQRDDGDDRRNADDHANEREHGAHLVGPERLQRHSESFFGFHCEVSVYAGGGVQSVVRGKQRGCSPTPLPPGTFWPKVFGLQGVKGGQVCAKSPKV